MDTPHDTYFTLGILEHKLKVLLERILLLGDAFHTERRNPEVIEQDCCDRINRVTSGLRRIMNARSSLVLFDL
jgi:hypothetical protein